MTPRTEVAALTAALESEHAVVFGIAAAGAQLERRLLSQAQEAATAHSGLVRTWERLLRDRGGPIPLASPWYALPRRATDRATALRILLDLEDSTAVASRAVVEAADAGSDDMREAGARALADSAVRAARWRLAGDAVRPRGSPSAPLRATAAWPGA